MSEQQNSLQSILVEALEIEDAQQRAAFLFQACGTDSALRREVEELFQAHAAAGKFLPERPAATGIKESLLSNAQALGPRGADSVPASESPGDRIGRYKLLQQIGEGGCGVVYMAEQEEPVQRRVALKVIKLGMDTKQVVARFEVERQALAMMDHPNIAKVFDAGATETGRPYYVMELVRGPRITEYCEDKELDTRERLELFIQVCLAVQHAHQKGIIHRDLKPSNILVTVNDGVPVPKVIDFGIAKATQGRLTDQTSFTAFDQFLGTPAYMSPEQAALTSGDVDTRSDVYSLGVLLYELLTSKTPFDTKELLAGGLDELRQTIREKAPPKPSTRLAQGLVARDAKRLSSESDFRSPKSQTDKVSLRRRLQAKRKLINTIRGDLDWIVMKCLEKERKRRYQTGDSLAADLKRYLNDEPVEARPPGTLYLCRKLLARNKLAFAAGGAVLAALIIGLTISTRMLVLERRARQRAVRAETMERQLRQEAQWRELDILEHQLFSQGRFAEAEATIRKILDIQKTRFGNEHEDVAISLNNLSQVLLKEGKLMDAELTFRESLAMLRKVLGDENPRVAALLTDGAGVLELEGKFVAAEAMHRQALTMRRKLLGEKHVDVAESLSKLAAVFTRQNKLAEAELTLREALAPHWNLTDNADPKVAMMFRNLAIVLRDQGKFSEAADIYREALPSHLSAWPSDPEREIRVLADTLLQEQKYAEAERLFNDIPPSALPHVPQSVGLLRARGNFRARRSRFRAAAADYAQAIEFDPSHPRDWQNLAVLLVESSQLDAYREHCRKSLNRFRNTTNPTAAEQIAGNCLLLPGSGIELSVVVELINFAASATNHERIGWFELAKGLAEYRQDHFTGAIEWSQKALARGGVLEQEVSAEMVLAMAHRRLMQADEARRALVNALSKIDKRLPKSDSSDLGPDWPARLTVRILTRQAKTLIEDN